MDRRKPSSATPLISHPVQDPNHAYPSLPEHLKGVHYGLGILAPTPEQRKEALHKSLTYMEIQKSNFMGYQVDHNLDYAEDMSKYLNLHVNNIGDPFQEGGFTMNSKFMERSVLDYYASLWNAKWPHDPKDGESYWGFCLTMGSTEANMYAMWNARDYLAGKILLWEEVSERSITPGAPHRRARQVMRQGSLAIGGRALKDRGEYPHMHDHGKNDRGNDRGKYPGSDHGRVDHQGLYEGKLNRHLSHGHEETRSSDPYGNAFTPVAFYSEDTHYSFAKAARLTAIRTFFDVGMERYRDECPLEEYRINKTWPEEVPSEGGSGGEGHIDVHKLAVLVEFFASKGYPILVSFNYGSTFKGAYDDVKAAGDKLMPIMKKYGLDERKVYYDPENPELFDTRTGFWLHVDGALGASCMPFIEMAHEHKLIPEKGPCFDFRLPYVHSICMSGHKWEGVPMPCGVFMTKTKYQLSPPSRPEYIGTPDTTFAGSRNGLSPMLLWHRISKASFEDQMHKALRNEEMAKFIFESLCGLEKTLDMDLYVARSKLALTVHFKQANAALVRKYSLSNESLLVGDGIRYYSHVFAMDHVTKEMVNALIHDLSQPGAFYEPPTRMAMDEGFRGFSTPLEAAPLVSYLPSTGRGYAG